MTERSETFVVGTGAGGNEHLIDLGRAHPSAAGRLTGTLVLDGDTVTSIDPRPGALHRGAEMLFAVRDYRQALSLANRHDWQAPFFGEWAVARAVEDSLGIDVGPRTVWLRGIQAERTRIMSHLAYLSHVAEGHPDLAPDRLIEDFRRSTAEWTGNRLHPMVVRLGGMASDLPDGWLEREATLWRRAAELAVGLEAAARTHGVGVAVVTPAMVNAYGLSGPVARASGVATDLRRSRPDLPLDLPPRPDGPTDGDASCRFVWLAREIGESVTILGRLSDSMPPGPVTSHLPKIVKLPEGDATATVEAPWGHAGVVITSRGEKTPWRLRLRTPSAASVSSWASVIPGTRLSDLPTALASLPWVAGELDK